MARVERILERLRPAGAPGTPAASGAEQERLEAEARLARRRWQERHAEASSWLLRAALLGHRRGLLAAADRPEAELVLRRAATAGVGYPVLVSFTAPEQAAGVAPAASAACDPAAAACALALEAAVRSACTFGTVLRPGTS